MAQNPDVVLRCVSCPAILTSVKELNKHYNRYHAAAENPQFATYCVVCGYTYTKKGHLNNHMKKQHPGYRYNEKINTVSLLVSGSNGLEGNGDQDYEGVAGPSAQQQLVLPPSYEDVVDLEDVVEVSGVPSTTRDSDLSQDVLSESIQLCIGNQESKITEMERAVATHEEEIVELKRDINDHKGIIETLKRDLHDAQKSKTTSMENSGTK